MWPWSSFVVHRFLTPKIPFKIYTYLKSLISKVFLHLNIMNKFRIQYFLCSIFQKKKEHYGMTAVSSYISVQCSFLLKTLNVSNYTIYKYHMQQYLLIPSQCIILNNYYYYFSLILLVVSWDHVVWPLNSWNRRLDVRLWSEERVPWEIGLR